MIDWHKFRLGDNIFRCGNHLKLVKPRPRFQTQITTSGERGRRAVLFDRKNPGVEGSEVHRTSRTPGGDGQHHFPNRARQQAASIQSHHVKTLVRRKIRKSLESPLHWQMPTVASRFLLVAGSKAHLHTHSSFGPICPLGRLRVQLPAGNDRSSDWLARSIVH